MYLRAHSKNCNLQQKKVKDTFVTSAKENQSWMLHLQPWNLSVFGVVDEWHLEGTKNFRHFLQEKSRFVTFLWMKSTTTNTFECESKLLCYEIIVPLLSLLIRTKKKRWVNENWDFYIKISSSQMNVMSSTHFITTKLVEYLEDLLNKICSNVCDYNLLMMCLKGKMMCCLHEKS